MSNPVVERVFKEGLGNMATKKSSDPLQDGTQLGTLTGIVQPGTLGPSVASGQRPCPSCGYCPTCGRIDGGDTGRARQETPVLALSWVPTYWQPPYAITSSV